MVDFNIHLCICITNIIPVSAWVYAKFSRVQISTIFYRFILLRCIYSTAVLALTIEGRWWAQWL